MNADMKLAGPQASIEDLKEDSVHMFIAHRISIVNNDIVIKKNTTHYVSAVNDPGVVVQL